MAPAMDSEARCRWNREAANGINQGWRDETAPARISRQFAPPTPQKGGLCLWCGKSTQVIAVRLIPRA
jgi:hypothetical protein